MAKRKCVSPPAPLYHRHIPAASQALPEGGRQCAGWGHCASRGPCLHAQAQMRNPRGNGGKEARRVEREVRGIMRAGFRENACTTRIRCKTGETSRNSNSIVGCSTVPSLESVNTMWPSHQVVRNNQFWVTFVCYFYQFWGAAFSVQKKH